MKQQHTHYKQRQQRGVSTILLVIILAVLAISCFIAWSITEDLVMTVISAAVLAGAAGYFAAKYFKSNTALPPGNTAEKSASVSKTLNSSDKQTAVSKAQPRPQFKHEKFEPVAISNKGLVIGSEPLANQEEQVEEIDQLSVFTPEGAIAIDEAEVQMQGDDEPYDISEIPNAPDHNISSPTVSDQELPAVNSENSNSSVYDKNQNITASSAATTAKNNLDKSTASGESGSSQQPSGLGAINEMPFKTIEELEAFQLSYFGNPSESIAQAAGKSNSAEHVVQPAPDNFLQPVDNSSVDPIAFADKSITLPVQPDLSVGTASNETNILELPTLAVLSDLNGDMHMHEEDLLDLEIDDDDEDQESEPQIYNSTNDAYQLPEEDLLEVRIGVIDQNETLNDLEIDLPEVHIQPVEAVQTVLSQEILPTPDQSLKPGKKAKKNKKQNQIK